MKKLAIIISVIMSLLTHVAYSQNLIAVQNGNNPTFYTKLDSAITHAQNGDTIYIPGGIFSISVSIQKNLHIVGVGHNPDSTSATYYTYIFGSVTIDANGSNGSLTGISLSGSINSNANATNYLVKRCVFNNLSLTISSTGWIFIENIIHGQLRSDIEPGASNCLFSNNIIDGYMGGIIYNDYPGFTYCIIRNNIFFASAICSYGCMYPIKSNYSTFENNIFLGSNYGPSLTGSSTFSYFNNNLFVDTWSPPIPSIASNNIISQPANSIFINQSGSSFSYSQNYHLQPTCPGKNAGTDGTDIGIYGGVFPWKDGSVPFNPHFQSVQIAPTTDSTGNLNVNIKVAAQDH